MKYFITLLLISLTFLFSLVACGLLINTTKYNPTITFEGLPTDDLFWLSSATGTITIKVEIKDVSPTATFCATVDGTPVTIASSDITRDASNATITVHLTPSFPSMRFEFSIFDRGKEVTSKEVVLKFGLILSPDKLDTTSFSNDFEYYRLEEGKTYTIATSLDIPSGKTLYIPDGVTMQFNGNTGIAVKGALKTVEGMSSTAKFIANSTCNWKGIEIEDGGLADISNIYIGDANVGIRVEDQGSGGMLIVSQSTFRCNSKGIYILSSSDINPATTPIVIADCQFEHNQVGIEVEKGYVDIEDCKFDVNGVVLQEEPLPTKPSNIASATGGVVLWEVTNSDLRNNTFSFNNVGVFSYSSHFSMINNVLDSNYRAGIYLYDSAPVAKENNINNDSATSTSFSTPLVYASKPICLFVAGEANMNNIINNSFSSGSIGIYIATNTSSEATICISNNDIYNNSPYNLYNDSRWDIDATRNYWGEGMDSTSTIGPTIYPTNTTSEHGVVFYQPWSTTPHYSE